MTACRIGKCNYGIIINKRLINALVNIKRFYILCNLCISLVVVIKVCRGGGNAVCNLNEASVGKSRKLTVGKNAYQRIKLLCAALRRHRKEEVLKSVATLAVLILCEFVENNLIELITALVKLLYLRFLGGKIFSIALFFVNRVAIVIEIIRNKSGRIHCIISLRIELKYYEKLLCTTLDFGLVIAIHLIGVVWTHFRKLLHPVGVAQLDTGGEELNHAVNDVRIAEHDHLGKRGQRHTAVNNLIAEAVLLNKLGLTANNTEEVKRLICLKCGNTAIIICRNKFLNKIVKVDCHLRKGGLLIFESLLHARNGESTLHIHNLQIVNSLGRIGSSGVSNPDTVLTGSLVKVAIEEDVSLLLKNELRLILGLRLSELNALDVNILVLLNLCRICKNGKRKSCEQGRNNQDQGNNFSIQFSLHNRLLSKAVHLFLI